MCRYCKYPPFTCPATQTTGRIRKIQSVISWERFWRVWNFRIFPRIALWSFDAHENHRKCSSLQGQPKIASPKLASTPRTMVEMLPFGMVSWRPCWTFGSVRLDRLTGDSPKVNKNACRMRQTRGAFPTGNSRCPCHQVIMSSSGEPCHQNTCVLYKLFAGVHDMTTQTLKVKRDPAWVSWVSQPSTARFPKKTCGAGLV